MKKLAVGFDKLLIDGLSPIFMKYNFQIEDQYKNHVKITSDRVTISISHNELDKGNSLSLVIGEIFS